MGERGKGKGKGKGNLWKTKCSWEHATFKWGVVGTLDETFPFKEVVFVDGAGGDAVGAFVDELSVFFEEAAGSDGGHGWFGVYRCCVVWIMWMWDCILVCIWTYGNYMWQGSRSFHVIPF